MACVVYPVGVPGALGTVRCSHSESSREPKGAREAGASGAGWHHPPAALHSPPWAPYFCDIMIWFCESDEQWKPPSMSACWSVIALCPRLDARVSSDLAAETGASFLFLLPSVPSPPPESYPSMLCSHVVLENTYTYLTCFSSILGERV